MIKVTKYDDIVWKKCDGCDNLVKFKVVLDTCESDLCNDCFDYLKEQVLNV